MVLVSFRPRGSELIDDLAVAVEKGETRTPIRRDLQQDSRPSVAVHKRDAGRSLLVVPDEDAPITPGVGIRHDKANDVVGRIVYTGELDDLAARVAVER